MQAVNNINTKTYLNNLAQPKSQVAFRKAAGRCSSFFILWWSQREAPFLGLWILGQVIVAVRKPGCLPVSRTFSEGGAEKREWPEPLAFGHSRVNGKRIQKGSSLAYKSFCPANLARRCKKINVSAGRRCWGAVLCRRNRWRPVRRSTFPGTGFPEGGVLVLRGDNYQNVRRLNKSP